MCLALAIPENLIDALRHTLEDPHESEKSSQHDRLSRCPKNSPPLAGWTQRFTTRELRDSCVR